MKGLGKAAVPIGVVAIVLMLVVPLPAAAMDMLIGLNLAISLLVLLVAMQIKRPLDFAVFPSLLLIATLFRLALNVSSTRLVLTDGYAGKVIEAFGHIVIGGSLVVGLVIFLILTIVQFVVITNGAGRVAEVGARFTLDAMPGKQMAIDADLNAGLINEAQARKRRHEVTAEADFYGSMDGASKFVKGDAIAGIVVTLVNLIGGFAIGMMQRGMAPAEAVSTYSLLTVGDGLVSMIPALLMSTATGIIVTRSATEGDMGSDLIAQLGRFRQPVRIAGGAALALCLIPGLPKLPFLLVGVLFLVMASRMTEPEEVDEEAEAAAAAAELEPAPDSPEAIAERMRVDPLELEVAFDLVDLVDTARGGDLLDRVKALRRKVAMETGLVIPLVRTRDNLDLPSSQYVIWLNGVPVAKGSSPVGTVLAIGDALDGLPGKPTHEPVFGLAAKWVPAELQRAAEMAGATVVDRSSVITTHLAEVVRQNAADLLGREDVRLLVEMVRRTHPVVVEELTPALLTLGEVQRVLHALLTEGVSIRDLVRIFEALSVRAKHSTDLDGLVEAARTALGSAISQPYVTPDERLHVFTLEPGFEQRLLESVRQTELGAVLALDAGAVDALVHGCSGMLEDAERQGLSPVLVCSPQVRAALARLMRQILPRLPVISYAEVSRTAQIESLGVVSGAVAIR
ncbi:flagellar biosynthesis protein FlhA [Blastococcus sp. MG754426]|uniref:flagellar biosynthesis protein FlhA n=1 Tax=unclassified Blastococcus TaxID=2619396 RepID=UPI001EEF8092|nr:MULTISPECIES: flagellar biosynthesis protein FlhA [unclassified Blastococcus]MCF6508640.1 flagellar biosynthesis protein FlhA [Blastococcus sp. MG754426]MCF6513250.1 flagellar biosynthesis protein FlhA [Blastococcus sp. MG754427]MCF6737515.1 flagellar biosynthesis protein FlhA [Blastococcus sp. KM273129]